MEDNELISQKINNTMADDRSLVWFDEKDGEGTLREHKALDLQVFDQYGGTADDVITGNSKLWFFIDHGQPASSNNDQSSQDDDFSSDPISGVDICNLCTPDSDFIEPNIPDIDFESTIPDIDYTVPTILDIGFEDTMTIPDYGFEDTMTSPAIADFHFEEPLIAIPSSYYF